MDIDECIDFLVEIKYEKVFVVVCDEVRDNIMPFLRQIPQLAAAFILSDHKSKCGQTTTKESWIKVKGVFTSITRINNSIKRLIWQHDEDNTPLTLVA